jgi:hypothetical protein
MSFFCVFHPYAKQKPGYTAKKAVYPGFFKTHLNKGFGDHKNSGRHAQIYFKKKNLPRTCNMPDPHWFYFLSEPLT